MELEERELDSLYREITRLHTRYLKEFGVRLPRLKWKDKYTKDALALCLFFKYLGKPVSKVKLTEIIYQWHPDFSEIQQGSFLSKENGFFIASGTRGDDLSDRPGFADIKLGQGEYCLVSLTEPYPGFLGIDRHKLPGGDAFFAALVQRYDHRCATCGSKEGENHLLYPLIKTTLQKGHMNPNKRLTEDNIIPQCSQCNNAYNDWFIFDRKGRVKDINIKSSRWRKKYRLK